MENYRLLVSANAAAFDVLTQAGVNFEKCDVHPAANGDALKSFAEEMAKDEDKNVITVVAEKEISDGERVYGIPETREEAKEMLCDISGGTHSHIVRMCIGGAGQPFEVITAEAQVSFKKLSEWEIDGYLNFDEYKFPAAYDPAGKGALFMRKIQGDFSVIKGLPIVALMEALERKYGITPANGKNIWWKGSNKE